MNCEKCADKGIILPDENVFERKLNEPFEIYMKRMRQIAKQAYCSCDLGQRILFLHKKADQQRKKLL